ncbi:MAG: transposase [Gammaproteobacteria bacterium]|nr:transposase [Gammaproteobacteria bacterium]
MLNRIREAWMSDSDDDFEFDSPVEVEETFMGGKRSSMSYYRKLKDLEGSGRGTVDKTAVIGIKDWDTNEARVRIDATDKATLHPFIAHNVYQDATVHTDDPVVDESLLFDHESGKHPVSEYVRILLHNNGVESFLLMLKREYKGTFQMVRSKHLNRYVHESVGKHNIRDLYSLAQMRVAVVRFFGRNLLRKRLTVGNGLHLYFIGESS